METLRAAFEVEKLQTSFSGSGCFESREAKVSGFNRQRHHNKGMQRTRNKRVSHARLVAGGGSCAPLMPTVMRLPFNEFGDN